jgi:cation diffusion facilitator family transporter
VGAYCSGGYRQAFQEIKERMKAENPALQNISIQRWVLGLSIALLLIKTIAYFLTNSVAILTDAFEAIVNVVAGIIGLYSLYIAAKPKDVDHPYGHGKIEFLSAAAEGVMISGAGILIIIEAVKQLINPTHLQRLDTGMILVAVTAVANFMMGLVCIRIGRKNNSLALVASGKHLHSDTYSTIGILIGLTLIYFTDISWIDSGVAIAFALFILYTGLKIIRTSIAGMMDETDVELLDKFARILNQRRSINWVDLHNLRIIKYGSTLHVDCHLTVPWYLNVHEAHAEIDRLAEIVRNEFSTSIELFVHSDGCLPISCPICIKHDCPVRHHEFKRKIEWTIKNIQQDSKHHVETVV